MSFSKALSMRRKEKDIFKLKSSYKVVNTEQESTYHVDFTGPCNTAYEEGRWTINLFLPEDYPYKSPSVGFLNKIYHPNIDYSSGSVCLDVINQTWTPMYELVNIFEIFLPQLLTYPNPASPLNHEAAEIFQRSTSDYAKKVIDSIRKYASNHAAKALLTEVEHMKAESKKDEEGSESGADSGSCSLSDHNELMESDDLKLY